MSWTQADLDALDRSIALGARRVRYPDGREVQFRDLADMNATRQQIDAAVNGVSATATRVTFAEFTRD